VGGEARHGLRPAASRSSNSLFFGFWLWLMMGLPLAILFLPIGTLPAGFVCFLAAFSLFIHLAMGAVNGKNFELASGTEASEGRLDWNGSA
jgi:hypothetical protein